MTVVNTGFKAGVLSVITSQGVLLTVTIKEIKSLADRGIKNIAISRMCIKENKKLPLEFNKNGIKAYAYNANYIVGFDECYVAKYELDYVYDK